MPRQHECHSGRGRSPYVTQYAVILFTLLTGPGQFIGQFFSGGLGPEVEIDRAELWLETLAKRGFTSDEALMLRWQMGEIVIGGAATALHKRAFSAGGVSFHDAAQRLIDGREPDHIPLLWSVRDAYAGRGHAWPRTLLQLPDLNASKRSEAIDHAMLSDVIDAGCRLDDGAA